MRRKVLIAMILCACASSLPPSKTPDQIKAAEAEFYKAMADGHYSDANTIATENEFDRKRVLGVVMNQMTIKIREGDAQDAEYISKVFNIDRPAEIAFARTVFAALVQDKLCVAATDTAYFFHLGTEYADKAIECEEKIYTPMQTLHLACRRPGTKSKTEDLKIKTIKEFREKNHASRDYSFMKEIVTYCDLLSDQYLDLYLVGLNDHEFSFTLYLLMAAANAFVVMDFQTLYKNLYLTAVNAQDLNSARSVLQEEEFKKEEADYDLFIAAALSRYQCEAAVRMALEQKLSDQTIESLLLDLRCVGATFEWLAWVIPTERSGWFFELSLKAQKFRLARYLIDQFNLGEDAFERVVDEGLAAKCFDSIMSLAPPGSNINKGIFYSDEEQHAYQNKILERILGMDEEWYITTHAIWKLETYRWQKLYGNTNLDPYREQELYGWMERAFLHSLKRGAFELAADIADKYALPEFREWGIKLAFEQACLIKNVDEAGSIVRRYKLGKDASKRVALLRLEKTREEEKKRLENIKKQKRLECKNSGDWNVEKCD